MTPEIGEGKYDLLGDNLKDFAFVIY
jgi:hypothetical protein